MNRYPSDTMSWQQQPSMYDPVMHEYGIMWPVEVVCGCRFWGRTSLGYGKWRRKREEEGLNFLTRQKRA